LCNLKTAHHYIIAKLAPKDATPYDVLHIICYRPILVKKN